MSSRTLNQTALHPFQDFFQTSVTTQYFADYLLFPLPIEEEIENAPDLVTFVLKDCRIVSIRKQYVVKYGDGVNLQEGRNVIFLRQNTEILLPRVYALYVGPSTGKKYTATERMEGTSLSLLWAQLSDTQKDVTVSKLQSYLMKL